jgi:ribonuclease HI
MDISQAFPSVSHDHLVHRLRIKRVPDQIVGIIHSFLSDRSTTLIFDDYKSAPCAVPNGLPQGSPLSALLYLIFADEFLSNETIGYIDDNTRLETGYSVEETTESLRAHMEESALPLSKRLGLSYDLLKFQLIHFVSPRRHRDHYRPVPLSIDNITIEASNSVKLLLNSSGVILDNKLSFRNHVELAQKRGTIALSRIAAPTFGLPHSHVRQLFQTVVVPRMEYALPVWYKPASSNEDARRTGTVWIAKALDKVQRMATRLITGALRTTATDTLDFHANLLPVHVRLNRSAFNAGTRLVTLPPSNPIHHVVRRCRYVPRFHRSAIHHLFNAFPVLRQPFEVIDPLSSTTRTPADALTARIAPTKEQATREVEGIARRGGLCVFTDGSGYEGGVGAAAVAMKGGEVGEHRTKHLGTAAEHTVFDSEVTGAILALDIVASTPRAREVDIFMDCQPAITALTAPKPQPGQYLIATFHAVLRRLLRARATLKVRLHWVPAHIGIAGNEAVDARAKEAALGSSSPLSSRIKTLDRPLPLSKVAAIAAGSAAFQSWWEREWASSPRARRLASYDVPTPSNATSRMYTDLSRPQCSVLTQLRTTHRAQRIPT